MLLAADHLQTSLDPLGHIHTAALINVKALYSGDSVMEEEEKALELDGKKIDDEQAEEAAGGVGHIKGTPGGNGGGNGGNGGGEPQGPWI